MTFTIEWIEIKTSAKGNRYARASINAQDGSKHPDVTIFSSFPNFDAIKPSSTVEGELVSKDYNGKTSFTLEAPKSAQPKGGAGIKAAQERKEQMIEKAQERKNSSIAYFNAVNSAIALLGKTLDIAHDDTEQIEKFVRHWRDWFLAEWEKYDARDISGKSIPF